MQLRNRGGMLSVISEGIEYEGNRQNKQHEIVISVPLSRNNIINGTADASATCKSMENKVNAAMSDAWASFESKLAQVQQEFNSKNG